MAVIAVINRKGGSGKSTLATHLAAYCSSVGLPVILGDVDRQQSTQTWLRLRKFQALGHRPEIVGWSVDPKTFVRPPAGVEQVILDTPGGLRGFDLARVVMYADAILMPVCNSVFDRESAAECVAELRMLPRVASGRCKLAAVGMRLDARTRAADVLQAWAISQHLPFIAVLRETQAYVRCIEKGISLFDLPTDKVQTDIAQWKPILQWLRPVLQPTVPGDNETKRREVVSAPRAASDCIAKGRAPIERKPSVPTLVRNRAPVPAESPAVQLSSGSPMSRFLESLPIPRFLQRS